MRLRSLLYVPAHIDKFVAKAHERGADAVILDLEDSVPVDLKTQARSCLEHAVPLAARSGTKVFVRINAGQGAFVDAQAAMRAGAFGLVLPKVETAVELDALQATSTQIIAIIETPQGLLNAREIAAHPSVIALILGAEDFATQLDGQPDAEVVRIPKLLVHYAAKAYGKLSLGLLRSAVQYNDLEGLQQAAAEAAKHGFDGATCVHPTIVDVLNQAFTPSEAAIEHAKAVIVANQQAVQNGQGAFMFQGEFIDAPIVERYKRLLARAGLMH